MGHLEQIEQIEQRIKRSREGYVDSRIPDEGFKRMIDAVERAKQEKKRGWQKMSRRLGIGLAAVFAVVCLIPNCSKDCARALMDLPVVGAFFEVITIRDYEFDDGQSGGDTELPKATDGSGTDEAGGAGSTAAGVML